MILRGLVIAYLIAAGVMAADYKLSQESDFTKWRLIFDFAVVSFGMTFLYHVLTFVS